MSQTILFVCATGIATSTAVTEKVMEYCKEHGLNVNYSQTNVASLFHDFFCYCRGCGNTRGADK